MSDMVRGLLRSDAGYRLRDTGFRMQDSGCGMEVAGFRCQVSRNGNAFYCLLPTNLWINRFRDKERKMKTSPMIKIIIEISI